MLLALYRVEMYKYLLDNIILMDCIIGCGEINSTQTEVNMAVGMLLRIECDKHSDCDQCPFNYLNKNEKKVDCVKIQAMAR